MKLEEHPLYPKLSFLDICILESNQIHLYDFPSQDLMEEAIHKSLLEDDFDITKDLGPIPLVLLSNT